MLDDLEGLPYYGLLYLLAIIDPHATRLDSFLVDSCCHRDAECHERAVVIRVLDDHAAMEEHEADLRHHSVDGAASCHP